MKLEDVELQKTTGFVIGEGTITIGSITRTAEIDHRPHSRVMLSSKPDGVTIWPVTQATRDEYGFFETTLGEIGVAFRSLSFSDIGALSSPGARRRSITRGGAHAGELRRRTKRSNVWLETPDSAIERYELSTEYGPEGLRVEFSGQVAASEGGSSESFTVEVTIPWATLAVKAIPNAAAYWKFERGGRVSGLDSASRSRDSRKFGDLLLEQGLNWPCLKGRIAFTPESRLPNSRWAAHEFVSLVSDEDHMSFANAPDLEVLDNGFVRGAPSNISVTLATCNRNFLESEFWKRDSISVRLEGDAIGAVRYATWYGEEPGDPFGWIHQSIKTMALKIALGKDGLEIAADGELDDFDSREITAHREKRNSQLMPLHTYSLRALMPWALLSARGFSFAYRVRDF